MPDMLVLILEFLKTGLFAVGGGYATLPYLHEMAVHYDWFTLNDLNNFIAISEVTPGPVGINMATCMIDKSVLELQLVILALIVLG